MCEHLEGRVRFIFLEQILAELLGRKALCELLDCHLTINSGFFEKIRELSDFDMVQAHFHLDRSVVIDVLRLLSQISTAPHFFVHLFYYLKY